MFSWKPQDLLASFGLISSYPNPNRNPNHYCLTLGVVGAQDRRLDQVFESDYVV